MTFLLDTNICVPLLNGTDAGLRERLLRHRPDEIVLCSIVKAELAFGAVHSQRAAENLERLQRFFSGFQSLPFDDAAAEQYGPLRALLRREGRPIGAHDMLIASIALAGRLTLVTRNTDEFARVPQLALTTW